MELRRIADDLTLVRVTTDEEVKRWRPSFVGAYQTIFSGPPYFERFGVAEAEGVWDKLTSVQGHITLLAVHEEREVVGFGISVPLRCKPSVARRLTGLVNVAHTHYFAELGVLDSFRGRGLGATLVRERVRQVDPTRFSHVVLRCSASRNTSYDMYMSLGFEDMGEYMEVRTLRTDGRVATDRRLFLSKLLSQVDV